ncbi:GntR family transcriptional regulator [Streptomyces sp. NPDC015171]|uniref:GntR family transcriptional regulator n=1 Tax=Streptomyces sp. NPDC015171 TaxID=3364945 RepID=UPI0036FBB7FF
MPERSENPHAPRAPYMDVLDALTEEIKGKRPGDPISSEAELCERHGVARETARRAVRILREKGLIETRWGKGSFVAGSVERGENERQDT